MSYTKQPNTAKENNPKSDVDASPNPEVILPVHDNRFSDYFYRLQPYGQTFVCVPTEIDAYIYIYIYTQLFFPRHSSNKVNI